MKSIAYKCKLCGFSGSTAALSKYAIVLFCLLSSLIKFLKFPQHSVWLLQFWQQHCGEEDWVEHVFSFPPSPHQVTNLSWKSPIFFNHLHSRDEVSTLLYSHETLCIVKVRCSCTLWRRNESCAAKLESKHETIALWKRLDLLLYFSMKAQSSQSQRLQVLSFKHFL